MLRSRDESVKSRTHLTVPVIVRLLCQKIWGKMRFSNFNEIKTKIYRDVIIDISRKERHLWPRACLPILRPRWRLAMWVEKASFFGIKSPEQLKGTANVIHASASRRSFRNIFGNKIFRNHMLQTCYFKP